MTFFKSVTAKLVLANVLCFLLFDLSYWRDLLAMTSSNILEGKYLWTLVTHMFMHVSWDHLLGNMILLIFVGLFLERMIGPLRYLTFYLVSGVVASLVFVLSALIFPEYLNSPLVGASGAIFGFFGLISMLVPDTKFYLWFVIPIKMKYAGWILVFGIWIFSAILDLNIGNWTHLGGLLSGIAYGFYLKRE